MGRIILLLSLLVLVIMPIGSLCSENTLEKQGEVRVRERLRDALVDRDTEESQSQPKSSLWGPKGRYDRQKRECLTKGWEELLVDVMGLERKILWKGPTRPWEHGAIIALHGGGGTYSSFCGSSSIIKPMSDFSNLAIEAGFAVFSLDSTDGLVTDDEGRLCGKRWDCISQNNRENIDLPFINAVITEVIPNLRLDGSSEDIFVTGISNGGFMTILNQRDVRKQVNNL